MPPQTFCLSGTLAPYEPTASHPWDIHAAQHLYRRIGFGADQSTLNAALTTSPSQLIDQLLDEAAAAPPDPPPEWANWSLDDFGGINPMVLAFDEWRTQWISGMLTQSVREKLALFWSNHFVTEYEGYLCAPYAYLYHQLLQQHALGNFRDFVRDMSKTPAMLVYLNGAQNTKTQPNENYARELYELFTLGRDIGYGEEDVQETARALSGWVLPGAAQCGTEVVFVSAFWDAGEKTIFGQTGNWGYDDVIDLLFQERGQEVATHLCSELYQAFIHPEVDENVVAGLAQTLVDAEFELLPVLKQLFKSEHFFDPELRGTLVKSPVALLLEFTQVLGLNQPELHNFLKQGADFLEQRLFNPPDVAGWPGHRNWLNTTLLTNRWQAVDFLLNYAFNQNPEWLRTLAVSLSEDSKDPAYVTQVLVDYFVPNGLYDPTAYEQLTVAFKADIPQNYFDRELWSLTWDTVPGQVALMLFQLSRFPEFQLT